jgi:hypothetical protein
MELARISALSQRQRSLNSATRAVASTLGVLVGLAGIEHGFFELLQGNVTPSGIIIDAIGPSQRFWEYGTERALTVIPIFCNGNPSNNLRSISHNLGRCVHS